MRRFVIAFTAMLLVASLFALAGCGTKETTVDTGDNQSDVKSAIEEYCAANGIDIPGLTVSGEKQVSQKDPNWEVDYAFPAEAEGEGVFFLLHKTSGGWVVVAHTEEVGWTAEQLKALGAPTDLVLERYSTVKEAIEEYCAANGIDIPGLTVSGEKQVSQEDPNWEVDYAFPAEAEGEGVFFLLQNTDGAWAVIAHTEEAGWTAEQLEALGAPTDLVL
jgi:hypothetical protein